MLVTQFKERDKNNELFCNYANRLSVSGGLGHSPLALVRRIHDQEEVRHMSGRRKPPLEA